MNELSKPKIGLLPLMLEMYRKFSPEMGEKQKPFVDGIAGTIAEFADVQKAPICSRREEIKSAVRGFESEDADLIVVVFISYATSISAINPLLETAVPLLLFSTSPKSSMAEGMNMDDIMLNHGVHGYMDLANVLKRNRRQFAFVSGKKDDVGAYRQIEQWAKTAATRRLLGDSVIGIAGYTFDGMGDIGIDTTYLHTAVGPEVKHIPLDLLAERIGDVSDDEIEKEIELDREKYDIDENVGADIHKESNRVYLGLKNVVKELGLKAFTMHFQGMLENSGIRTLPFLGISKLQEAGLCYSGEGDFLGATACMMLRFLCGDTVFTETFCPDFDGGRIVMAHMGESNPAFGTKTVLRRKKFVFGKALDPVIADTHMKPQKATVLNFGIAQDSDFQMLTYTGEVCERIPGNEDIDMPYFHFKPSLNLEDLLYEYGIAGGTHHIAMTPGDRREDLIRLAEMLGIDIVVLT